MSYYKHISLVERSQMSILHRKGYSSADIAIEIGCHKSTVCRELRRNTVAGEYCSSKAHHKAYTRRKYSKYQAMRIVEDMKLREYIHTKLLDEDWSPEQIAGRLAHEFGLQQVSAPTIYKYIRSPYGRRLEYELQLAQKKRSNNKKKWQRKVTKLEGRIFIDKRPQAANDRSQYGHWEGDFIVSGKAYGNTSLLVLHERVSRYTLIARIDARTIKNVEDVLIEALPVIGQFKSLTLDNDIAFVRHKQLSEIIEAPVYFCQPYHSWEKGGVENANRLIRRYVPKGCNIAHYSQRDIWDIQHTINDTPRKILGYKTATEVFLQHQKEAVDA
jgi:IS30 family transposase